MSSILQEEPPEKLSDLEQELYDAALDEYNDIFENILNINEKTLFEQILISVKAIFGETKMKQYSKISIAKVLSSLKIKYYMPDYLSLKKLKEIMLSLGSKDTNKKIPELQIDDIYAHCKECSKCYHTCGEILLMPLNQNYIICLKCKMVYKKEMIHLYCKECQEEYYSYIIDYNEPVYDDYFPATWDNYHCPNYICEEMVCPKCDSMLYYNDIKKILKCFGCKWNHLLKNMKWKCELCDAEFTSGVKEYIKYETKPLVNCVRNALINKIPARPAECVCCNAEPRLYNFQHNDKKGCKGNLYIGFLQKKPKVVCSNCRLVQNLKDVNWLCPNCGEFFICNKVKNNFIINVNVDNFRNTIGYGNRVNNYLLKPLSPNKKSKHEKYFKLNEKIINDGRNSVYNNGKQLLSRGKSFNKNLVISDIRNNNKEKSLNNNINKINENNKNNNNNEKNDSKCSTSRGIQQNNTVKNGIYNIKKDNILIKEENENNSPLSKKKTKFEPLSKYFLSINKPVRESITTSVTDNNNLSCQNIKQLQSPINCKILYHNRRTSLKDMSSNNSRGYNPRQSIKFKSIYENNSKNNGEFIFNNSGKNLGLSVNLLNKYENKNTYKPKSSSDMFKLEPDENFIPEDFIMLKQVGEGTFGKIYCSEWIKNKKKYAMKKMILRELSDIKLNQEKTNLVYNFIKETHCNGVIKTYGAQCEKKNEAEYTYYVLMELADIDWEKEIKKRSENKKYYTEGELFDILKQLIKTFALLQKNNITHRDVKPQNILIIDNKYKIGDFGEAKNISTDGVIKQNIRGTELYMSPILFKALNSRHNHVIHNTYKSDVFSLGMCLLLAATLTFHSLYDVREIKNMDTIKNILVRYLIVKYSYNFVGILLKMLEVNEDLRPDFIQLEKIVKD